MEALGRDAEVLGCRFMGLRVEGRVKGLGFLRLSRV